jgi:hypothetical protein
VSGNGPSGDRKRSEILKQRHLTDLDF